MRLLGSSDPRRARSIEHRLESDARADRDEERRHAARQVPGEQLAGLGPHGVRTHLPLFSGPQRILRALGLELAALPGRLAARSEAERARDVALEASHRDALRPRDPAGPPLAREIEPQESQEGLRLDPGEPPAPPLAAKLRAELGAALEPQQGARLAGRDAELLARIGSERPVVATPLAPLAPFAPFILGARHAPQQRRDLGIERLLVADGEAQAPIELVGVRLG
jgi:hypothetical protein